MLTSAHYAKLNGVDCISKNKMRLIYNLVNTAKAFYREGKTSHGRVFHCTFAIEHGKVKMVGFNSYKHTIDYDRRLGKVKKYSDETYVSGKHSEIDCILKLGDIDFSKITFLNVHINRNFKCSISRPCLNCYSMMKTVGVKSCWFYDDEANKFLELKL